MQHAHRSQTHRAEARVAVVHATSVEVASLFGGLLASLLLLILLVL